MTTATPEQLAALVLPATLPGVVRPFTPLRPPAGSKWDSTWIRGCALEVDWDVEPVNGKPSPPELFGDVAYQYMSKHGMTLPCVVDSMCLRHWLVDLTDATARAHVAWAVASACGLEEPLKAVYAPGRSVLTGEVGFGIITQSAEEGEDSRWFWDEVSALNMHDDTRLPDGSRCVDAEALRLVALQVLGDKP
jgi:hypothetical protein